MTTLPISPEAALSVYQERARILLYAAKAPNTLRSYRASWQAFTDWCEEHHLVSLPAEPVTVALYLAALAESAKIATLEQRVKSIS